MAAHPLVHPENHMQRGRTFDGTAIRTIDLGHDDPLWRSRITVRVFDERRLDYSIVEIGRVRTGIGEPVRLPLYVLVLVRTQASSIASLV